MILEYFRPKTLDQAALLLNRPGKMTIPIGGGTSLGQIKEDISVIDLQSLELSYIKKSEAMISIGSTTILEELLIFFEKLPSITQAIKIQASKNQRDTETIAGLIISENGRSPLLTLLLALDIKVVWHFEKGIVSLDEVLHERSLGKINKIITEIRIENNIEIAFDSVGRSIYDQPIISCAIAHWENGRSRIVFGGYGIQPHLAYDGILQPGKNPIPDGFFEKSKDQWASSEYRDHTGKILCSRLLRELNI
ncbi:MAG: FAD binding domain-containing protein [Chloroflexi bacterium]|nr:FAD binding domain-containing protein [Chloroflexota bacterium]